VILRLWEATTAKRMQIDPYCQRRKCMGCQTRKWSSNMRMLWRVYLSIS